MRTVYVVPGSGGTFYCGNCLRDISLITALRKLGQDVIALPMYLPLISENSGFQVDCPVFYGAINVYLKQKFPLIRKCPRWLERVLDAPFFLKYAAKKAGSTRASALGEITLSMLNGEKGMQASELKRLVTALRDDLKPDIIHLSNALLLGIVRQIKQEFSVQVVCFLQDEDTWIDALDRSNAEKAWNILKERSKEVDIFISVSKYYADFMQKRLCIPEDKLFVVPIGVDLQEYGRAELPFDPPVIGYLSRMSESSGLGLLVDAFIKLKEETYLKELKLRITGGHTGDDNKFIKDFRKKLKYTGFADDVEIITEFHGYSRTDFLNSLTVFSVPALRGGAFGLYLLEALAAGVPVVQPKVGAFPEIINKTNGGIVYEPNDADTLAGALSEFLLNPERARNFGQNGRKSVLKHYSIVNSAKNIISTYEKSIQRQL